MNLRQLHAYIGLFIAPSIIFFALTGSLQLFNLHEAHGAYSPPPILQRLSAVHKDQVFALPGGKHAHDASKPKAGPAAGAQDDDHDHSPKISTLLLKWFFLVVALGLVASTCVGLWLGLTHVRHKRAGWSLLIAGAAIPLVLLLI